MGSRVLVAEDDAAIRDSLGEILEDAGDDAVGACNGRQALEILGAPGPRPALILLDMTMPVMDGAAFRTAQRATAGRAEIPVIVFSADRDLSRIFDALHVQGVFHKPLPLAELLATIARFCRAA